MPSSHLRPAHEADLSSVEAVFTDVDGTLTTRGKLTSSTLRAIEWLGAHHVPVVLVSGRPAGWAKRGRGNGPSRARSWKTAASTSRGAAGTS